MPPAAAADTTTTTEFVPRITGDPLPDWVVVALGAVLLVVIVAGGWFVTRRTRRDR